ncbi:hypothetical protein MASR2M117_19990 [Paludibacter sp.]
MPIVIITTDVDPKTGKQYTIRDEPKVPAAMKIVFRQDGSRNYVSDANNLEFLNYNGKIGIEFRGSTSQTLSNKPYGLTTYKADNVTNNNVSILDMPKENDWVLNALAFDNSLIRDYLSYDLYREMGNYSPRQRFVEVIINGDYKGLYIFMEKLKIDKDRINITKMTSADNVLPELSGGYVTKSDKPTGGDPIAWQMYSNKGAIVDFIHHSPKPEEITLNQQNYIKGVFLSLASVASNSSIVGGYPEIIDVPSFIDFMLMSEFASNVDSYQYSTFYHKDRNGKLRAGPIWDYNLTYGLDLFYNNRSLKNVWQFNNNDNEGPKYWYDLFNNAAFRCYLTKRWKEVNAVNQPLNYNYVSNKIDQICSLISEAALREKDRWGNAQNWSNEIATLKSWISGRIEWINSQLKSYNSCANVQTPKLAISKINYHPMSLIDDATDDTLEFIAITNNSSQIVNLTGIYFRELGLVYQFPDNATIQPNQEIYLASNADKFKSWYGIDAFDQYFRFLSNKSQRLWLADAYGNTIDDVTYYDESPWPVQADGQGYYLQRNDLNVSGASASNWIASNQVLTGTIDIVVSPDLILYPSPATDFVRIANSNTEFISYEIFDITGQLVGNADLGVDKSISLRGLSPNIYLVKLHSIDGQVLVKRVIKR